MAADQAHQFRGERPPPGQTRPHQGDGGPGRLATLGPEDTDRARHQLRRHLDRLAAASAHDPDTARVVAALT